MGLLNTLKQSHISVVHLVAFFGILLVFFIMTQVNHYIFRQAKKKQKGLHLLFFERVNSAVLLIIGTILAFSVFGGAASIWKSLLGGTAIVSAVLAFAAQDAIKDILAGLMISLYKPFEVGNRIELEDGTAGIVEDLTMRHAVLRVIDSQKLIIPNSKLNAMSLKNFSYHTDIRSKLFDFYVGYDTNVEMAMNVVRQAVMQSSYSVPGKKTSVGMEYGPVYFMAFEDSSLRLSTTVYFPVSIPSEIVISDINLRVDHAFWENKIEIPYAYVNVLQPTQDDKKTALMWKNIPVNKHEVADIVVDAHGNGMEEAIDETAALGRNAGLSQKESLRLRLLAEELFGLMKSIVGNMNGHFWVDHEDRFYAIHLETDATMNREMRRELLSLSTTGENAAAVGFVGKLRDMLAVMMLPRDGGRRAETPEDLPPGLVPSGGEDTLKGSSAYVWSMQRYKSEIVGQELDSGEDNSWDELEKSIVSSLADEVSISIEGTRVEITIFKQF